MNHFAHRSIQGVGIGLRTQHYQEILENCPPVPWSEALTENYIGAKALPLHHLLQVRNHYPLTLHGVSLSIGSTDPLNWDYLRSLKKLATTVEPTWISDHLCWTSFGGRYIPDLFALPHNEEAISHVVQRIQQVQDFLGQRILLENVSRYVNYQSSLISEWEFLREVAERADCYLLLDINNIYVNAFNHQFCALTYLQALPASRIKQFHLAGHQAESTHLLDSHGQPVSKEVWELYSQALQYFGQIPTLLEWDLNIPSFETVFSEARLAHHLMQSALTALPVKEIA